MKNILPILALSLALTSPAFAQDSATHAGHGAASAASTSVLASASESNTHALTAGEITRVDARTGKLTIRHEDIKNLDMPAMTMVFALEGSAQRSALKAGDKVLFHAEDKDGTLTITHIQPAP